MRMNERIISKVISKKAVMNLRIAKYIFLILLLSIISVSMLLISRYVQTNKDFYANIKMHLIQVTSYKRKNINTTINFNDVDNISKILKEKYNKDQYQELPCYFLNFGISTNIDKTFFIYGLDDITGKLFFGQQFKEDTLYFYNKDCGRVNKVTLRVPTIEIKDGGFFSNKLQNLELKTNKTLNVDVLA